MKKPRCAILPLLLSLLLFLLLASCTAQGAWDLLSGLGGLLQPGSDPWFDSGWVYRHQLVFDNTAQAEDLSDFPVLVVLDPSWGFDYGLARTDGTDLRFVDGGSSVELAYEIECWNRGSASSHRQRSRLQRIFFYSGPE